PKDNLAVTIDVARETGAVYYDTKGLSDWTLGNHPVTGRPFSFDGPEGLLTAVKGIGWDVPVKLYDYMHYGPRGIDPSKAAAETPLAPARADLPRVADAEKPAGKSSKHGVQDEVDRMLIAGHKVSEIV